MTLVAEPQRRGLYGQILPIYLIMAPVEVLLLPASAGIVEASETINVTVP